MTCSNSQLYLRSMKQKKKIYCYKDAFKLVILSWIYSWKSVRWECISVSDINFVDDYIWDILLVELLVNFSKIKINFKRLDIVLRAVMLYYQLIITLLKGLPWFPFKRKYKNRVNQWENLELLMKIIVSLLLELWSWFKTI